MNAECHYMPSPNVVWFTDARESHKMEPGNQFRGTCRVRLNGVDIADRCYRIERYADGSAKAFCYVRKFDEIMIDENRNRVVEELTGEVLVEEYRGKR